ncbi:hypothetical protein [Actinosynnema sp. NPDC020468]|uniref:hypothetical protein n=1 Tax=Actinosynnema sp. NPDC020468 TaxID=3154488 RepID=UPI0033D96FEE
MSAPTGNSQSTSRRLCAYPPRTTSFLSPNGFAGTRSSRSRPENQRPVPVSDRQSRSGVPSNVTRPPPGPAAGPSSTTWSAAATAVRSCSTGTTGPGSSASLATSAATCSSPRPVVGSSTTCSRSSTSSARITASRNRCASPRESVGEGRSSGR